MRNKATFFGILIVIGVMAAVIGTAMISGSSDTRSVDDTVGRVTGATGAPAATGIPKTVDNPSVITGQEGVQSLGNPTLAPGSTPGIAQSGGSGVSGGVGGAANSGGGTGATVGSSSQIVDRKIERNSTLSITVDNVTDAVNRIQAAAGGAGGYVSQQNITETAGPDDENGNPTKRQTATVQIRVPSEAYDSVMSGLRGIAKEVTSENTQTTEVTAQYTDLQSQLRNLEATEAQYLALLERAETINDILTVSDRLASVRLQIEQLQGQVNLLDNLTSLATITLTVTLPPLPIEEAVIEEPVKEPNFARQALDDAWDASENVLEFMAVAAITAGVVMVWVLIPGVLLLIGWRLFGGRRGHGPAAS